MAKLALAGGSKAGDGIREQWPFTDREDVENITRVIEDGLGGWCRLYDPYGGERSHCNRFEQTWAEYHDAEYALGIANGTVAIDTGLRALGLSRGAEVICPSITFIASASGILMAGGIPVFADVDPETCQISAEDIERKITPRTQGILVVHYGGYPVDLTEVKRIADKHGLFVFEDCAHAQGTEWEGRKVGAIGDIGSFSFQGSKSLTSGEGGAIITDSRDLIEKCFAYHHIGRVLGSDKYDHTTVGPNYRLSELQAAVLYTQLKKHPSQTETRMKAAAHISEACRGIPGLTPLKEDRRITQRGYYFYVLRFDEQEWGVSRKTFIEACNAEGIQVGTGYGVPVYKISVFANTKFDATGYPVIPGQKSYGRITDYRETGCPNADRIMEKEHVTISCQLLNFEENGRIFGRVLKKVWENRGELQQAEGSQVPEFRVQGSGKKEETAGV